MDSNIIKKYNFIVTIIGLIFSLIMVITFFPKISNGSITINFDKDLAFLLYYGSIVVLYGGILWNSTVKKLDYGLKIDFTGYNEQTIMFALAATMSPSLMLIFGTFDSFGPVLAIVVWVIVLTYVFLNIFLNKNKIFKEILKYIIFALCATFLVVSVILLDENPFTWLGISYIVGNIFYIFSFLFFYKIIKFKYHEQLFPILFLLGSIVIYLGNILVFFNAY